MEAVKGRVEVYLDGGIRQGTDVFKALALGARAVFIGRPVLWGLAYQVCYFSSTVTIQNYVYCYIMLILVVSAKQNTYIRMLRILKLILITISDGLPTVPYHVVSFIIYVCVPPIFLQINGVTKVLNLNGTAHNVKTRGGIIQAT